MLKNIKKFIKERFINEKYPLFVDLYLKRFERKWKQHENMSYSEIESYIDDIYEKKFHRKINWNDPKTYTEKIHVSKLYDPTPLKTRLADKVLVREWIKEKIGEKYLIPLIGVYNSFDEIDFDKLPDKFVMKCNHDSGSYILCTDKSQLNIKFLKIKYKKFMNLNYAYLGFEMHYRDIVPKIIIEKYMGNSINDYKFLCFGGKPYFCWVDIDRQTNHKRNFYDMNWNLQPISFCYPNYSGNIECPDKFNEMKDLASKLSENFDQVRVDFYFVDGKTYFGEFTFASENGFAKFIPEEWDYKLGDLWKFDKTMREKIKDKNSKP